MARRARTPPCSQPEEIRLPDANMTTSALNSALGGEIRSLRSVIAALTPVIHARVGRALHRRRARFAGPLGLSLLEALLIEEEPIASVCARTGMSACAVQAWSSRLRRRFAALAAGGGEHARSGPGGRSRAASLCA
ncbi:hypothetical protein WME73_05025 [Sorangium sp. So ce302]|uniref:hypothetical protein n=1 Tax=Sorangium sp. So ce302 TaxID=3133297 RepID=UPI003F5E1FE2